MTAAFISRRGRWPPDQPDLLERVAVRRDEIVAHADRPGDLRDVEVAVRVERETVRRTEVPRTTRIGGAPGLVRRAVVAEARDDRAALVADCDAAREVTLDRAAPERPEPRPPAELGDERPALRVEGELRRPLHIGPLREELAVGAEHLDAVVLAVADEHAAVRVHGDAVREHELARAGPGLAPGREELAARREAVDPRIPVAVGDVQVAVRRDREVRRPVEGRTAPRDRADALAVVARVGWAAARPEREQELAVRRELSHGVVAVVGAPDRPVGRDGDAVRAHREDAFAPRADEAAVALVDQDGMVAAPEEVHATAGIDGDGGHVAMREAGWQPLPGVDRGIRRNAADRHSGQTTARDRTHPDPGRPRSTCTPAISSRTSRRSWATASRATRRATSGCGRWRTPMARSGS